MKTVLLPLRTCASARHAGARGRRPAPGAGQPAAIAANQIGPHTTLIEKHEARGIERRRRGAPDRAGEADVSAIVFRRVYRFF